MKHKNKKKWLIFDAMGVIYEVGDDTRLKFIPYVKSIISQLDDHFIYDQYLAASVGSISAAQLWQSLGLGLGSGHRLGFGSGLDLGLDGGEWEEIQKDYLDNSYTLDSSFVKVAETLQKKYNLAMLSNDIGEWSAYLRRKFDIDRLLKNVTISGDVGYRKPDKAIYRILLDQINALAEDCTFFDDRNDNLVPAYEMGMKVVHFNRYSANGNSEGFRSRRPLLCTPPLPCPPPFPSICGFDEIPGLLL